MKLLISSIFFLFTLELFATDYKIVTEHYPPYQIYENNKLSGISVDIVAEIQKRAGSKYPIEILPWSKAYTKALHNKDHIIFSMGRTLTREKHFQWVGPISNLKYVFFKNADNTRELRNIADAKKAAGILVSRNDLSHQVLLRLDFKNLIVVDDSGSEQNMRTLANVDKDIFWATDYISGLYKIERLGLKGKLKATLTNKPISASTINIAFNKDADPKMVEKWQKIFNEIKSDGTFKKILLKYD